MIKVMLLIFMNIKISLIAFILHYVIFFIKKEVPKNCKELDLALLAIHLYNTEFSYEFPTV